MIVYWYIDKHGSLIGTLNKHKRNLMAAQNYCDAKNIGECDISEFTGQLISSD